MMRSFIPHSALRVPHCGRRDALRLLTNDAVGFASTPWLGWLVAKELRGPAADLPPFVSVAPQRFASQAAFSSGFLGPQFAPLLVADGQGYYNGQDGQVDSLLKVQNLGRPQGVKRDEADARLELMKDLQAEFVTRRPGLTADSHRTAYAAAVRLM